MATKKGLDMENQSLKETKLTLGKEELEKIATMSSLDLSPEELEDFSKKISEVIEYMNELTNISPKKHILLKKNINIFREDIPLEASHKEDLIKQAPEFENNYFVIPSTRESK